MPDKIVLSSFRVSCRLGVSAEERKKPQTVFLAVEFGLPAPKPGYRDRLDHTVDYAAVYRDLTAWTRDSSFHLLEALGEDLSARLLRKYPLIKIVKISLTKKAFGVPGLREATMEIERRRS